MIAFLRRNRWWLVLACLTAGVIGWWQLSTQSRFTRAQYDRIRIGMTPAEVRTIYGWPSSQYPTKQTLWGGPYESSEMWVEEAPAPIKMDQADEWLDESIIARVYYGDGKTVMKQMEILVPPWRVKADAWLDWLRGLLGR